MLFLAHGATRGELDLVAHRHDLLSARTHLLLQDFSAEPDDPPHRLLGVRLTVQTGVRWFGAGTYAVDLRRPEPEIFASIPKGKQKEIQRAERRGLVAEVHEAPGEREVDAFLSLYAPMARARGLDAVAKDELLGMTRDRAVWIATASHEGAIVTANVVYVLPGYGYYLHGASADRSPEGAGHLAQWRTMTALKARRATVYDLGLVSTDDPKDGIHWFKKSLGGAFVPAGRELVRAPLWHRAAETARSLVTAARTSRILREK